MRNSIVMLAATMVCLNAATTAASAATPAVATANVNLRAGPSTHFPVVRVVPAGASLVTFGCVNGYTWCDVAFAGNRGWLAARYVRLAAPGVIVSPAAAVAVGIPLIGFSRAYWRTHYPASPWVGRFPAYAARWRGRGFARVIGPGRRGIARRGRAAGCVSAGCSGSRTFTGPGGRSVTRSFSVNP
jgi:uncharacterized protein YraI